MEAKFMRAALRNGKGATLTRVKMATTFSALADAAKVGRWGKVEPEKLTEKQIRNFVSSRIEAGLSVRSCQNEMSHIRRALTGCGRSELAERLTNADLGISGGRRTGEGRPVDAEALAAARAKADDLTRACIDLGRSLGLRQNEIIQSSASLGQWERQLAAGNPAITVQDGTKGGKIRDVFVPPTGRQAALEAVRAAIESKGDRRHLVTAKNLEAARQQLHDRFSRVGLSGENSAHSLRRAFCLDNFNHYRSEGLTEREALSRCSRDLGHGEGRGRWVKGNYLKGSI